MLNNVINISRAKFKDINFYPTRENPQKTTHAFISIYGTEPGELKPRICKVLWHSGIFVQFDDVEQYYKEQTIGNYKKPAISPISKDQAKEIVDYIQHLQELPDSLKLIVHCYAGVSRSAAVGKFINDYYKMKLPQYERLSLYNKFVYHQLMNEVNNYE